MSKTLKLVDLQTLLDHHGFDPTMQIYDTVHVAVAIDLSVAPSPGPLSRMITLIDEWSPHVTVFYAGVHPTIDIGRGTFVPYGVVMFLIHALPAPSQEDISLN